jgi:iron complex outermembrane receptor protein
MHLPSTRLLQRCLHTPVLSALVLLWANAAQAQEKPDSLSIETLKNLSLEELMDLDVTSVSRREEKLSEAPSAIQVITADDIRRSGASSLPEALRLAGNLHIGQKNSHDWAISARGFNTDLANKLLVLIDGRTVYTPLFSGVFWDRQDYLLEDIERIEVISGPGGTLWGANAVNGVINIITKKSVDTQGLYAEAGAGSELRSFAGLRYGGRIGSTAHFRVYGKYTDRDDAVFPEGGDAGDAWSLGQGGFRIDADPSEKNSVTVQGDYYAANEHMSTGGINKAQGANILGRWSHIFSDRSVTKLQLYFDNASLDQPTPEGTLPNNPMPYAPAGRLKDNTNTFDLDFQHSLQPASRHQIVWGLGYRRIHDEVENAPTLAFEPEVLDRNLVSLFAQDKIMLAEKFYIIPGTKIEHNDYTGFEFEPSVQLQSTLADDQTLWASVSRAVRMPSRIDRHVRLPTPGLAPLVDNLLVGGDDFKSEILVAYELGYRARIGSVLSGSISTFYNVYDDLRSTSLSPPDPITGLPFPLFYANDLEGETYGLELNMTCSLSEWWRLRASYDFINEDIRITKGGQDFNNALNETADPRHRVSLRSSMNLSRTVEFDAAYRWIDSFIYNNAGVEEEVDAYGELQARIGWHVSPKLEVSVVGQNLLHESHLEYVISGSNPRAEVQRGVYGKIALRL